MTQIAPSVIAARSTVNAKQFDVLVQLVGLASYFLAVLCVLCGKNE